MPVAASSMRSSSSARDAEARSDDAARVARVHALGQHFDRQHAVHEAAQRGRAPELLVVAAARIEADDEVGRADPRRERFEIRRQVVAAALLAALDQDRAARVRRGLRSLQRARAPRSRRTPRSRRPRRRGRRACRRAMTRRPRPIARRASRPSPAACRGGRRAARSAFSGRALRGTSMNSTGVRPSRRTTSSFMPGHRVLPAPARRELDRGVDMAVLRPVLVEVRRLGRDPDVLGQRGNDASFQKSVIKE